MYRVFVVGAGQLGSRHLQALKAVGSPLEISVVDPREESLRVARERYEAVAVPACPHRISFGKVFPGGAGAVDLAIVATNSDSRRAACEGLFASADVRFLILEKLLFDREADYEAVGTLLEAGGVKAWVNCSMRAMPYYFDMKARVGSGPVRYRVSGSRYGLVTNAIHYIDHMIFLTGCAEFQVRTSLLDPHPVPSKRKGFLELNGTLEVHFGDGSLGVLDCYPGGDAPQVVEVFSPGFRCISRESEGRAWVSHADSGWRWMEEEAKVPFQSQMTKALAEEILSVGKCPLVGYAESARTHLALLEPLRAFLREATGEGGERYLFT